MNGDSAKRIWMCVAILVLLAAVLPVGAQQGPVYRIPGEAMRSTLYHDGSQTVVQTCEVWTVAGHANLDGVMVDDLRAGAARHEELMEDGPVTVVDSGKRDRSFNIVFNADSSVPDEAIAAMEMAEEYLEGLFLDDITITITMSYQDLGGGGTIGYASSSYIQDVLYTTARAGLQNGMDGDDVIQSWLPSGYYLPVRWNASSGGVTYEYYIDWTKASYKSTIGTTSGNVAAITFNTQMDFDYDPSNGCSPTRISFVDVLCHEVGHTMGFTTAVDGGTEPNALDIYRFSYEDGGNDYNPDTYEEFQTTPRLIDFNNPDDSHICDVIDGEYRMEDGDPWQASHLRQQSPRLGLMAPAISDGETFYPDYYFDADLALLDAMGWDYPPCIVPVFTEQPPELTEACAGDTVVLSVAVSTSSTTFQWRRGATALENDGEHIFGATTTALQIVNVGPDDEASNYNCLATNQDGGCSAVSDTVEITTVQPITISEQPESQTLDTGDALQLGVSASGELPIQYQWRHDGVDMVNGSGVFGVGTANLLVLSVDMTDAGEYDCVVTNVCGPVPSEVAEITIVPPPYGACCLGTDCFPDITGADCDAGGGVYQGDGTVCEPNPCVGGTTGACCYVDYSCAQEAEADCTAAGGTYHGDDTECTDGNGNDVADLCECHADANCDGAVNFDDLNFFVAAVVDQANWEGLFEGAPPCDYLQNDCNWDTYVNFDDINAFVDAVVAGECVTAP